MPLVLSFVALVLTLPLKLLPSKTNKASASVKINVFVAVIKNRAYVRRRDSRDRSEDDHNKTCKMFNKKVEVIDILKMKAKSD